MYIILEVLIAMIIKRTTASENSQEQRDNPATEIIKPDKEVLENLITATMVSKAMGTLKKSDITLLAIVYNDIGKDMNLELLYGNSGPISEFISEGKKFLSDMESNCRIKSIELVVEKPFSLKSVTCHFHGNDKDVDDMEFNDFSRPFSRIVYRLK